MATVGLREMSIADLHEAARATVTGFYLGVDRLSSGAILKLRTDIIADFTIYLERQLCEETWQALEHIATMAGWSPRTMLFANDPPALTSADWIVEGNRVSGLRIEAFSVGDFVTFASVLEDGSQRFVRMPNACSLSIGVGLFQRFGPPDQQGLPN